MSIQKLGNEEKRIIRNKITKHFDKYANADYIICGCGCGQELDYVHGFAERIRINLLKEFK